MNLNWIQFVVPPLMMIIGGIITWFLKTRSEELKATEEKLHEARRKIYIEILDPFIRLFSDLGGQGAQSVIKKLRSSEYRKTAFELNIFGSDEVITAYNNLFMHTFEAERTGEKNPKEILSKWGELLLEIRKSLGNEKTELDAFDMLRGMIKDIDKL